MESNELESLKKTNSQLVLALRQANCQAEEFERRYYLEADKVEALTAKLANAEMPTYWMSIQHGEFKVSYTDDSDPAYKWFPVWTRPLPEPDSTH